MMQHPRALPQKTSLNSLHRSKAGGFYVQRSRSQPRRLHLLDVSRCSRWSDIVHKDALIIPMDTKYQDKGMFKAYGLVYKLLQSNIPIHSSLDSQGCGCLAPNPGRGVQHHEAQRWRAIQALGSAGLLPGDDHIRSASPGAAP